MFLLLYYICIILWEILVGKERRCVFCCSVLMVVGVGRGFFVRVFIVVFY